MQRISCIVGILTLQQWEWHNNYTPGPEVYDQLWHIRKEPVIVTPFLPIECPVSNAHTRILDRRQTEGDIQRNFYVIEATYLNGRGGSVSSAEDAGAANTEIIHVDLSRIMDYVSPDELERFENEQFRVEAEAEAVAIRAEAEAMSRRRLEKNARTTATGPDSPALSGLGLESEKRPRGRPRGRARGRGRGRGSWRGSSTLVTNSQQLVEDLQEELVDMEPDEEVMQLAIPDTESEEEEFAADERSRTSPTLARSAFVANSALPVSPILSHRRLSTFPAILRRRAETSTESDPDIESMPCAAIQLQTKTDIREGSEHPAARKGSYNLHRDKRRRTESTVPRQRMSLPSSSRPESRHAHSTAPPAPSVPGFSSDAGSGASDAFDELASAQPLNGVYRSLQPHHAESTNLENIRTRTPVIESDVEQSGENEDTDTEEYVVESIIEHYREAGKKYYLVKWQGYEDSHDWLPEEDLEGAAEVVAEYNARIRKRMGKQKRIQ
jgi:hypothetical protein